MITFTHNQVSCNLHFPVSHRMFILLCTEWTFTETEWNQSQSAVWREFSILQYWLRLVCRRPYGLACWHTYHWTMVLFGMLAVLIMLFISALRDIVIIMLETGELDTFWCWRVLINHFSVGLPTDTHQLNIAMVLLWYWIHNWYFPNGKFYHVSCPFRDETPSKSFF